MRQRATLGAAALLLTIVAACGGDDSDATTESAPIDAASTTVASTNGTTTDTADSTGTTEADADTTAATDAPSDSTGDTAADDPNAVVNGEPFPEARCAANREAGTIRYLSGFDFAAAASIINVVVAKEAGYFEDLCLDVELQSSFSTSNYPLVAGGEAQIGAGGSFSELVDFATTNAVDVVAVDVEGRTAIDSLIVRPDAATELADLKGSTIGVKGKLPPSINAMLAGAGLVEGTDYQTVLLDGYDPVAHYNIDDIVGFPGYKSNEPGTLERAGLAFTLFDPTEYDVPGSFGVLFVTRDWAELHPTALQDFMRATMRGMEDAIADPAAATSTAVEMVEAGGNPNYLSPETETFRWATDSKLVTSQTPDGVGIGIPDAAHLQTELDAYAKVGLFGGTAPEAADFVLAEPIAGVYDGADVIWPG